MRRFRLDRVLFVPTAGPPHKRSRPLTPFAHRFAMLALATAGEPRFEPSLLESDDSTMHYSIITIPRVKRTLPRGDRLFFLIGVDAFLDIGTWRSPERLLRECDFIVASRPGFSLRDVLKALPAATREAAGRKPRPGRGAEKSLSLGRTTIYFMDEVQSPVSATEVRVRARQRRPLGRLVPPAVAAYIRKADLYRS
jgi:nicotinate-nucleotide adenylyltransferase